MNTECDDKRKPAERAYEVFAGDSAPKGGVVVKAWTRGVSLEDAALAQLKNMAALPFVYKWVAAMPDVHLGMGATIGSVIPTREVIIPAAVGVDIGCGMMAVQTSLRASDLPDSLHAMRSVIEAAIPHGRTQHGGPGDRGAWAEPPEANLKAWAALAGRFEVIAEEHPKLKKANHKNHLGTLGTGNHFIEVCIDEMDGVWLMLHSGSRGVGNRIGSYFIALAKKEMERFHINLPDKNLAYLPEGSRYFEAYKSAVSWAQDYAAENRRLMMSAVVEAIRSLGQLPDFNADLRAVNCHHNYVAQEHHYGENVYITRKGAVRARVGDWGIIPGSMGARSYIVRGKGNAESFCSCSHGAGRAMSRTAARRRFSRAEHAKATAGIECRKDDDVIDETPMAYKPIEAVMEAQKDLVEIAYTLRQVVCVKG